MTNKIKPGDKVKLQSFENELFELLKSMREYVNTEAEMMPDYDNDEYAAAFKCFDGTVWYWPLSAVEKI